MKSQDLFVDCSLACAVSCSSSSFRVNKIIDNCRMLHLGLDFVSLAIDRLYPRVGLMTQRSCNNCRLDIPQTPSMVRGFKITRSWSHIGYAYPIRHQMSSSSGHGSHRRYPHLNTVLELPSFGVPERLSALMRVGASASSLSVIHICPFEIKYNETGRAT